MKDYMSDTLGVIYKIKAPGVYSIRIRGFGPRYDNLWALLSFMIDRDQTLVSEEWDDFPWSGFTTTDSRLITIIDSLFPECVSQELD